MYLFDHIPEQLFQLLASPNKSIYIQAMMTLYKAFQSDWSIKRSDLVIMLVDDLDDMFNQYVFSEDESEKDMTDKTSSSYAHFLLRRLKEYGWIEIEYADDSFNEMISIPDYSFKIIQVLYEIASDAKDSEYNRYVYSTYSVLKTSSELKQEYMMAVNSAYNQTIELLQKLKMLLNNIKRYHRQLSAHKDMNQILIEHFDDFKATLSDKIYYPIKTFDSVHRYKNPILNYVKNWLYDEDVVESMSSEVWMRERQKKNNNEQKVREEAKEDAVMKMVKIIDIYENMDGLLKVIDKKNSDYTRATLDRIEFLLNTDRSVKGKVREIIKALHQDTTPLWHQRINDCIAISTQDILDEKSLYVPRNKKTAINKQREKMRTDIDRDKILKEAIDFKNYVHNAYSQEKIYQYMLDLMGEVETIEAKDIPISNDHEFISTMLGVMSSDDQNSKYTVRFKKEELKKKGYTIPDFRVKKNRSRGKSND